MEVFIHDVPVDKLGKKLALLIPRHFARSVHRAFHMELLAKPVGDHLLALTCERFHSPYYFH